MSADSRQQVLWCYLDRTAFRKAASETLLIARFAAGFFALAVVADFRIRGGIALFKFQKILDGYCGNIAERLFCEERLMRGDNDIWHRDQPYQCVIFNNFLRAVLIEQVDLFFVHVQSRSSDFMAFQPFNEHFRIYQSAAGCVDNHNAGLHAGDSGVVDHMPGLVGQRAVQRDDVRLAQKLRQIHIGKVAGRVRKFIIVQHTHIEALADIRENAADFARADDADGFAVQIEARQTEIEGARADTGSVCMEIDGQQQRHCMLGHCVGGICRNAENMELSEAGARIHVVEACAAQRNDPDTHLIELAYNR